MAETEKVLGIDLTDDIAQLRKFEDALAKVNIKLAEGSSITRVYNPEGKSLTTILKGITEAGQDLTATLETVKNEMGRITKLDTVTLKNEIKAFEELNTVLARTAQNYIDLAAAQNRIKSLGGTGNLMTGNRGGYGFDYPSGLYYPMPRTTSPSGMSPNFTGGRGVNIDWEMQNANAFERAWRVAAEQGREATKVEERLYQQAVTQRKEIDSLNRSWERNAMTLTEANTRGMQYVSTIARIAQTPQLSGTFASFGGTGDMAVQREWETRRLREERTEIDAMTRAWERNAIALTEVANQGMRTVSVLAQAARTPNLAGPQVSFGGGFSSYNAVGGNANQMVRDAATQRAAAEAEMARLSDAIRTNATNARIAQQQSVMSGMISRNGDVGPGNFTIPFRPEWMRRQNGVEFYNFNQGPNLNGIPFLPYGMAAGNTNQMARQAAYDQEVQAQALRASFGGPRNGTLEQNFRFSAEVGNLNRHLTQSNISLERYQQLMAGVRRGTITAFTEAEERAIRFGISAQNAFNDLGSANESATRGILLSWRTMMRLFEIQILHTMFGGLITRIQQGIQEAGQLSIKIGEIMTISQDKQLPFDTWVQGIKKVSDTWGKDFRDVTEATYQVLSNQIAKGADALSFMDKAAKFSIASVSSLSASVNLLTAAMNAYGYGQEETNRIAAQFFKTIDLGRVRAEEMESTLGRILPTAARMGIKLEEVNAAIATLTISGMKYNEAFTLINNVMMKLLKPSDALKETLTSWGYSSGEAALAGLGFGGVLKKLEEAAGGADTELVAMFNNIRAARGVLGLTGNALDTYERSLQQIKNATQQYNNAIELVQATPGKKLSDEMNKIRNMAIQDGMTIVNTIVGISNATGGLANNISRLVTVVTPLAGAYLMFRTGGWLLTGMRELYNFTGRLIAGNVQFALTARQAAAAQAEIAAAGGAGRVLNAGPMLATAGIGLGLYLIQDHFRRVEELEQSSARAFQKYEEIKQRVLEDTGKALDQYFVKPFENTDYLFSQLMQRSAGFMSALTREITNQAEAFTAEKDAIKAMAKEFLEFSKNGVSDLKKQNEQLEHTLTRIPALIQESKDRLAKTLTDEALAKAQDKPLQQVDILVKRYTELRRQAEMAAKEGNLDEFVKRSNEMFTVMQQLTSMQERYSKAVASATDKEETAEQRKQREEEIASIRQQIAALRNSNQDSQIAALQQRITALQSDAGDQRIAELQAARREAQGVLDSISRSLGADLTRNLEGWIQSGYKQIQDQAEAKQKQLQQQIRDENLRQAMLERSIGLLSDFSITTRSGAMKYKNPEEAMKEYSRLLVEAQKAGLDPNSPQYKTFEEMKVKIARETQLEITKAETEELQNRLKQERDLVQQHLQKLKDMNLEAVKQEQNARQSIAGTLGSMAAFSQYQSGPGLSTNKEAMLRELFMAASGGQFGGGVNNPAGQVMVGYQQKAKEFLDFIESTNASIKNGNQNVDMNEVVNRAQGFISLWQQIANDPSVNQKFKENFQRIIDSLTGQRNTNGVEMSFGGLLTQLIGQGQTLNQATGSMRQIKDETDRATKAFSDLTMAIVGVPVAMGSAVQQVHDSLTPLINSINEAAEKLKQLQGADLQLYQRMNSDLWLGRAMGGGVGTDSIPALLSRGEYVVNSDAVGRFYPQIAAMNATRPQHVMAGGDVSFGDIHVHGVPISGNVSVDARAMGRALRQELRRGTISPLA